MGMRIACWINTHLQYVILIAFSLPQWSHERALMLRLYVHCLSCLYQFYLFSIVVPCILITLKFFSQTNAPLYYTYKLLKYTARLSHECSYMFWSTWTIIYRLFPQNCKFSEVQHRLPDDGPGGPKQVGAIMR